MNNLKLFKIVTLLSLLLAANVSFANGVLKGRVIDNEQHPLPAATVIVVGSENNVTIADNEGYYTLTQIPNGEQEIKISYLGFANQTIKVTINENQTTELNVTMQPDDVLLDGVEVSGRISDRAKALNVQKENLQVSNVVSSDQVDRFPDANIGDALKRLPSINVQYDQGEARFVNIRGTSAEYANVTINGSQMASAEGETRAAQFDLIPSDMIKTIEVDKVTTPDMDGDAIGGAVNLVTRGNPTDQSFFISLGTGYNQISGKATLKGSAIYANRFMDGKLGMTLSASVYDNPGGSDNHEVEWAYDEKDVDNDGSTDDLFAKEIQIRQYYVERLRQSYSASFDYKFNADNKIELKAIYNDRKDWENRYRTIEKYKDSKDKWYVTKEVKAGVEDNKYARLEHQRLYDISLKGEHQIGKSELKWKVSTKGASEKRPNERYLAYEGKVSNDDVTLDLSSTKEPMLTATDAIQQQIETFSADFYDFDELTEEEKETTEKDYSGKIDFKMPLMSGDFSNKIKIGAKVKYKDKDRNNDFYNYTPLDKNAFNANSFASANIKNQTRDGFMSGDYTNGDFVSKEYVGDLDLDNKTLFQKDQVPEELAENYNATEMVSAAYLRFDQKLGEQFDAMVGVRFEQTHNEYEGMIYDNSYVEDDDDTNDDLALQSTGTKTKDYLNVLPSILLRYRPIKNFNVKASFTQTIARPRYFDLVPFQAIEHDGSELNLEMGNPDLEATTSSNFDLMAEYFLPNIGVLSGGVFYKDINDIIIDKTLKDQTINGQEYHKVEQRVNGGDGILVGFELAYQQQLTFLPGFLKQMSAYVNYTHNYSEINNFEYDGREDEKLSMPGTPENTLNASLMYDNDKISTSISYNFAGSFIDDFGDEAMEDRYYDKVNYLDFNFDWRFYKGMTFSASINNILNQPLRYYQNDKNYTMQAEYYGTTFSCGLKYKF